MGNLNFVHILFWPKPKEGKSLKSIETLNTMMQGTAHENAASIGRIFKRSD